MTEFASFDPDVEVRGEVLMAWIDGTRGKVMPYLEEQGIPRVENGLWYRLQTALDALYAFSLSSSLFNAGLLIPEHAVFPPDIQTFDDVLKALDTAYHMNHRNGEIGHYQVDFTSDRHVTVTAENPYPCEFDFGLLRYLAGRFAPEGIEIEVVHDPKAPCRKTGDHSCTYHLKW